MADQTVRIEEGVAATAYHMATNLWLNKHDKSPTMDDEDFIKLVSSCAKALRGTYSNYSWAGSI